MWCRDYDEILYIYEKRTIIIIEFSEHFQRGGRLIIKWVPNNEEGFCTRKTRWRGNETTLTLKAFN